MYEFYDSFNFAQSLCLQISDLIKMICTLINKSHSPENYEKIRIGFHDYILLNLITSAEI